MKIDTTHLSGKVVAVALSGGVDSVVLLHSLLSLKDTVGFELKAIHIEHGIRPVDSVEDMHVMPSLSNPLFAINSSMTSVLTSSAAPQRMQSALPSTEYLSISWPRQIQNNPSFS